MASTFSGKIVLALAGLGIVGGILVAQFLYNRSLRNNADTTGGSGSTINEILLAALADPTRANESNPPLQQRGGYTTDDLLALRITTTANAPAVQEMRARLLQSDGLIKDLDPPSVQFTAGTSTFCCWQVDTPGEYTLQLFRPDGAITTFKLSIKQSTSGGNNNASRFKIF